MGAGHTFERSLGELDVKGNGQERHNGGGLGRGSR
jgi:hypothetical protein